MDKEVSQNTIWTAFRRHRIPLFAALMALLVFAMLLPGCSWFGGTKKAVAKKKVAVEEEKTLTCPLCGLPVSGLPAIDRRPVAVKVENDPSARPQSGLDKADIIYEEDTEGGITRFMAIYLCRDVATIGPVRSARPADIDLVFPYDALFCHCGGGAPVLATIKQAGIPDLDQMAWPGAYWRASDRRAPHNLYTSTDRLRTAGNQAFPYHGQVAQPFVFLTDEEQATMENERAQEIRRDIANQSKPSPTFKPKLTVINNVYVPYQGACRVRYSYAPNSGRFMRFVADMPNVDRTTGAQLAADNVIVQYVTETASGIVDVNGVESPDLGVVGYGKAQVFVRGRLIEGDWAKSARNSHTQYTDSNGNAIKFKPGTPWIELVSTTTPATMN